MSNHLNIKVDGGSAVIGNVVQGEGNTATANVSASVVQECFDRARDAIARRGTDGGHPAAEVQGALEQLERLKTEAAAAAPNPDNGSGILKAIKDNFEWAYPMVKDFVAVAWPALLALVA